MGGFARAAVKPFGIGKQRENAHLVLPNDGDACENPGFCPQSSLGSMSSASPPSRRRTGASFVSGSQRNAAPDDGARLVCTAGPSSGTEFPLGDEDEVVIGRATENAVSIPDTSVSRKHTRVRREGHGWICEDLGSGNGTVVNGETIEGEHILRDGDVLALGDTEFRFVEASGDATVARPPSSFRSGERPVPVRSSVGSGQGRVMTGRSAVVDDPRERRKRRMLLGLAALLVAVGLGVLTLVKARMRVREDREREVAAATQAKKDKLADLFQEGKNLVREGKWTQAKERFAEVKQLAPDYPTVDGFLERSAVEIPNEAALARAKAALAEDRLGDTAKALAEVSLDTQLFEIQAEVTRSLDEKVAKTAQDVGKALRGLPSGAGAKATLQKLRTVLLDLKMARPDSRDASVLLEDVESRLRGMGESVAATRRARKSGGNKPWDEVEALYLDGALPEAMEAADECRKAPRCAKLSKDLKAFAELIKKVDKLDAAGLAKVLTLDRSIGGGAPSRLAKPAELRASTTFYKTATAAKAAGQWSKAVEYAKRTLDADAGHSGAKALLEEVRAQAKDVYLLAYSMKDGQPDEAVKKFREVLQMTPRGDEYNTKAANWIRQLER